MARFPHRGPLAGVALALAPLSIAQAPENWSLRLPPATSSGIGFATHPQTGRPVRYGGYNNWLGNVSHLWEWSGTSWLRHSAGSGPGPRTSPLLVTDTAHHRLLLLFGGNTTDRATWTWDGVHWQAHATPLLLTIRPDAAMACDTRRGRVVLFGGGTNQALNGDTWEWDGAQWLLCQPGLPPAARYGHRMAFDAARGAVVLFGGRDATSLRNDTWEWDGTWWFQRFPQHSPAARQLPAIGYDPLRQRVVLQGGSGLIPILAGFSDTWEWDGADWTQVVTPHSPPAMGGHALGFDGAAQRLLLCGSPNGVDELWQYDGVDWSPITRGSAPSPRSASAMTDDPLRGEVVLFGGSASTTYGDTWTWDGERWLAVTPALSPSARSGHALAFDPVRGVTVLFGGYTYGSSPTPTVYHDATWTWDGTTWTQLSPATRPAPRLLHGLAWHAASQRVVLFGGRDYSNQFGDTWTWDGANWTQEQPAAAPSPRFHTGMAPRGQDVVLFGGGTFTVSQYQTASFADTWLWNGTNWLPVATATAPPSRYLHTLVYDSDRDRVLVTGGLESSSSPQTFSDLWAFDGITWTQIATTTIPGGRSSATMAYDPRLRETILFGGGYNDTWILAPAAASGTFGSGCPGALGVPAQVASPDSRPEPGGVVEIDVTNLPGPLAVVAMGFSNTTTGSQPLPLSLAPFGMPGCDLLVAPDAAVLLLGAGTTARWTLPLPYATGLFGVEFFHQAFAYDPTANSAGLTTSAGGRLRIGT